MKMKLKVLFVLVAMVMEFVPRTESASFTSTGAMTNARIWHTATLLPNGKVLVAGGLGGGSSAELYTPSIGIWTATAAMPIACFYHTATLLPNGKVLVVGGQNDSGSLSNAVLYDAASDKWTTTGGLHNARYGHTATLLPNGKVLVTGGYYEVNNPEPLSTAELYDPTTGTWTMTNPMSNKRRSHTATLLANGKVMVSGGVNDIGGYVLVPQLFDPVSAMWSVTGAMTSGRNDNTATLLANGKVLLIGGNSGYSPTNSAELYDPATGTWKAAGSLNATRDWHTATILPSGKLIVVGGYGNGAISNAIVFDPDMETWVAAGALNTARYGHTATLLPNGKVLVAGGGDGNGPIFSSAELYNDSLVNQPFVFTQPQSQLAQIGSNAIFSVTAYGQQPLNYQWQFNGQNITGATNATLTLNLVTAANSGGYSVVVSNPYGSVTSATASLAVLTDGANGNKPVPITATPSWSKPSTVKNLVFVTHGWQPVEANPFGPPAQPWMAAMTNAIAQQLGGDSTWQFETYDWTWASRTLEPQQALSQAEYIGTLLGKAIAGMGYQQVHLIAHSAGSGMIQAIADQLRAAPNPPQIQLTFLDPYIGIFHQEQNNYGKNADWSDCYFVEDGTGGFTGSYLNLAFNVDVSWVDPAHTAWPYIGLGGGKVALSSHGYPIDFYLGSMTGGNSPCSSAYGFALSEEMEGVFWFNSQANYPVGTGPFLPCSPADAVKNPIPGIAGLESGAAGAWTVITDIPHALSQAGATLIGNAGAELQSIWSALPLVKSGGIQPADNTANTPAWLAMGLTVTNAVNFVQFDAGFTDTNTAQGLLTVYWNTNQVGMVDERVAQTNLQTYRFLLPGTVSSGLYTLSFRLDSFANSSTVAVTNVTTGFVGMTQPSTLRLSITNRAPLVQLTAATNFTYLIQSSTNLVDWTPTAMLLNTNGTVQFTDSAVTNSKARFYRAVVQ